MSGRKKLAGKTGYLFMAMKKWIAFTARRLTEIIKRAMLNRLRTLIVINKMIIPFEIIVKTFSNEPKMNIGKSKFFRGNHEKNIKF